MNLVRYCDDFVITGKSKEILEKEVTPLVQEFLTERGLRLSQEKTQITPIEDGFDFWPHRGAVPQAQRGEKLYSFFRQRPATSPP